MLEQNRSTLIFVLWFFSSIVLAGLFISAASQGELTSAHVLLAFVILGLAVVGTPYVARLKDGETDQAKTKRRQIDNLLRDMSDEDLIELKQRLSDVDSRAQTINDYIGDDGELVQRR